LIASKKDRIMSDISEAPKAPRDRRDGKSIAAAPNFDLLAGVSLRVSVEVGSTSMALADLLTMGEGSVVELDRAATDLLDIYANGTLIAKGEIVSVDGRYGIQVAEVVAPDRALAGFERRV
jgi:flagellar motor switch protein FliN/FliY